VKKKKKAREKKRETEGRDLKGEGGPGMVQNH
jgi:hypothetical protein